MEGIKGCKVKSMIHVMFPGPRLPVKCGCPIGLCTHGRDDKSPYSGDYMAERLIVKDAEVDEPIICEAT